MQLVPTAVRLTDNGRPPAGQVPATRLSVRDSTNTQAVFDVEFADSTRDLLTVSAHANGAWRWSIGNTGIHDMKPAAPPTHLSVTVDGSACRLLSGNAVLDVQLDVPAWQFRSGTRSGWRSVDCDLNVGNVTKTYALFKHSRGFGVGFELQAGEHVYGGGEDFGGILKNGRGYDFYNADALGVNGDLRYQNTPYLFASRSGGLALLNAEPSRVDVGLTRHDVITWSGTAPGFTLWLQPALPATKAVSSFRHALPQPLRGVPGWSLGLWMSRCYYKDQKEVLEVVSAAEAAGIELSVINLDARCWMRADTRTDFVWDTTRFDPFEQFIPALRARGLHVCLWENPYVSSKTETLYTEGVHKGYFAKTQNGDAYPLDWVPEGLPGFPKVPIAGLVDFTNPAARAWWKDLHRPFIKAGVRCFKTDFGEEIPADAQFSDGSNGWTLRNVYADLYNACVTEVLQEEVGSEGIVWARSGWFGTPCTPVKWGGDSQTSWRGLRASLRGGLNQAAGGALFWSHDIGGFYGPAPDAELYLRWCQIGLWGSHARCHGTTAREPWAFGDEVVQRFKQALAVRKLLKPYFADMAAAAVRDGLSVVCPMWLAYPDDPQCGVLDDQWFVGRDIVVAPFVEADGGRRVYLPAGGWCDLRNGCRHDGPQWLDCPRTPHVPAFGRVDSTYAALWSQIPALLSD